MGEDFEESVDTSSFDDMDTDTADTSSFSDSADVGSLMDDIPEEPMESFDAESIEGSFETDLSDAETADIDSLMDDAADQYATEDVSSDVLDASGLDSSDISSGIDEYETDAGSEIADLMDEAAMESFDEVAQDTTEVDDSAENDIETLMEDVEPVSDNGEVFPETETEDLEIGNGSDTEVESLLEAEEIPEDESSDLSEDLYSGTTEENLEGADVSALMDESDAGDTDSLVDETLEGTTDDFETEDVDPVETGMENEIGSEEISEGTDPVDAMPAETDTESDADISDMPADEQGEVEEVSAEATDAQPDSTLDAEVSAYDRLAEYYNSHNYGQQHYAEYSKDPEWQELNNAYLQELGQEPIDYSNGEAPDIHEFRDELIAAGIPEGSPELDAILANEQAGIEAIEESAQRGSSPIDPLEPVNDVDSSSGPMHLSQRDFETFVENSSDKDALQNLRDGIVSGDIQIDADDIADGNDSGPVLTRDVSEQWESGNRDIDETIEAMRDDLRDKGLEDGPEMESIVMVERARMQEELERNIRGDFSNPYQKPDFGELLRERQMSEDLAANGQDIPQDIADETPSVSDLPNEINYDEVFEGLEDYDFDGIDFASDADRLDHSLDSFDSSTWEGLTLDEQKAAMTDLADYVKDVIGFDNPPEIVYYNNPVDGDYGGYSPGSNTLEINEYMLYNNEEAADTVAHELWHAYQHQRAGSPQSAKDYQYQYGFENYIRPEDDFSGYQNQLVEAEARAFAQQFKDRLNMKGRRL